MTVRLERHIPIVNSGDPVVDLLAEASGLSKQSIKQTMQKGAVWITRGKQTVRVRRAKKAVQAGETLHLYYDESVLSVEPPIPGLIADEGAYSVWNKPYGMLSQGSKWGDHCTINRWVEQHLAPPRPCFIVHRLDRAATGLILLAHSKTVASQLSEMFKAHTIEKRYRANVYGAFPKVPAITSITTPIDGKSADSHISLLRYDEITQESLLEVHIGTGRKHQIRRHLAQLGYPIIGDRLYGKAGPQERDLQLQAFYLAFTCPVTHTPKCYRLKG